MVDSWVWPRAAYIHIPFCAHKCGYCDFASLAGVDHLADRYLTALESEMARMGTPQPVETIFVGGGTPTRLDAGQLRRLLAMIGRWFLLEPGGEWTVEANPGTLDEEKADVLAAGGVNRVSLGAQSFQPGLLQALERNHAPEEVGRALDWIRPRFPYWSFDLIFGVPGSTLPLWEADLETALSLGPAHLSCYGLVYEKGTALWKQWQAGQVREVDEEAERAMYEHTIDRLRQAGLLMYEISNFARPGHESRHNLIYWANDAYFGVGVGAARYVGGVRSVNTRDLPAYLRRIEEGREATGPIETLEPEAHARETAVLMLRRTIAGIDRSDFMRRTGFDLDELAGPTLKKYVGRGLLEEDGNRVRFTREGLFLADSVLCELV
ncbi:radical SAM family heme chaperone HemW [Singulisphaera acidiphila]|uniref:Heme chaperone HemW n=1 Tax=Singulisphaera acidiphila (strain ATCC BAA-1392 / DSM 18658 / VKM B-2454 / MOB10) TaxID=886293 RepID=L0DRC3_SINAD|nr:radical SAM family heme chaperone HemW [Singulisphaera acidiphila]AGA30921.1 putative oxygen-independent coproporphyrinogen III oxidase [Singulisphaera acidiphila DSM 18658]